MATSPVLLGCAIFHVLAGLMASESKGYGVDMSHQTQRLRRFLHGEAKAQKSDAMR